MSGSEPKALVLITGADQLPTECIRLIESRRFAVRTVGDGDLKAQGLHKALHGVAGYLMGGYEEPSAEHFERATELQVIGYTGTDFRGYVPGWQRAFELGVALASTPGANAISVAEFTIRLILTLARPLPVDGPANPAMGRELHGRTLGILGAGRIGSRVARIAALGLGMHVLYTGPRRNESLEAALGVEFVDLGTLLEQSDIVSLHCPSPARNSPPLLGRAEMERLAPGALIINAGHPELVDPAALGWAMEYRGIRAACDGLGSGDHWNRLAEFPLTTFLYLKQSGFQTVEASLRSGVRAAEAICDVLDGRDSPWVNNPDFREKRLRR